MACLDLFLSIGRNCLLVLSGLGMIALFCALGVSQDTVTGAFQGDVSNSSTGNPIGGVAVRITSVQTGRVYIHTTDSKGRFYQGLLAPGLYDISIELPGYKPRLLRREIKVSLTGDVVPVPVSLDPDPSPVSQPAVLEDADNIRVEINTTDARRGASFDKTELQTLPLGAKGVTRSFDELALLVPGVAPPPQTIGDVAGPGVGPGVGSAGQFAVNGMRSRGNNFTVDGSDNNDEDIGVRRQGFVAFIPQPIESVEEFNIITLLASAQFGRNIGAQVNAVSRAGGNKATGSVYGTFNSHPLNARDQFDATNGSEIIPLLTASGQNVLLDGQPTFVQNRSGGEAPFTYYQFGGVLGGAIKKERMFYFVSAEFQKINALREKSFAVPTVEERGPFRSGASGFTTDPFTGAALMTQLFPTGPESNAIFSLFPFPNDPAGIYGANTFTQTLRASGRGTILSGRLDNEFSLGGRRQSFTSRYNFTDDVKEIPSVNEAIFGSVASDIQTQNLSLFLNSTIFDSTDRGQVLNQVRFSFGRTRLDFSEIREGSFLLPSDDLPDTPFMLNARAFFNVTLPEHGGQARYSSIQPGFGVVPESTESVIGPLGQVIIAGYSPLGVDVYNFPQHRVNSTFQIADELTWRRGKHTAVFGADIRRTDLNSDLPRLARTLLTFNGAPRLVQQNGGCPNGGIGNLCFLPTSDPLSVLRPVDIAGLGAASNSILTLNLARPDSKVDLRYHQINFYGQDTWRVRPDLSLSFGLRYEYNTPIREINNLIEDTFSDETLDLLPVLQNLVSGRQTLYDPDRNNFAPRVGLAYSKNLFGTNRLTVIRAGYGRFFDQVLGAVANQARNVFPSFVTFNFAGALPSIFEPTFTLGIGTPAKQTFGGVVSGVPVAVPLRQPGTLNSYNRTALEAANLPLSDVLQTTSVLYANAINVTLPSRLMETPNAHHYSFTFEQQLSDHLTISAGYVGTSGRNLLRFTTPNLGSSLTVSPTVLEPHPLIPTPVVRGITFVPDRPLDQLSSLGEVDSLGAVNQFETTGRSTYHSLQTQLRARFLRSLDLQASYVFSKANDEVSDVFDLAGAYVLPQNSFDLRAEWGPANFDVRHRVAYDLIYSVPRTQQNRALDLLTNGLTLATTGRYHSGQPFTVNSLIDVNLDGNLTDRLDSTAGIEITGDRSQPLRLTTDDPISMLAPFGQNGRVGRNTFRAGSVLELDVAVIKRFSFSEKYLDFRTDIFNITDRANFGVPIRLLEAPGFGKAVNTVTPGRRIQFSLKFGF